MRKDSQRFALQIPAKRGTICNLYATSESALGQFWAGYRPSRAQPRAQWGTGSQATNPRGERASPIDRYGP